MISASEHFFIVSSIVETSCGSGSGTIILKGASPAHTRCRFLQLSNRTPIPFSINQQAIFLFTIRFPPEYAYRFPACCMRQLGLFTKKDMQTRVGQKKHFFDFNFSCVPNRCSNLYKRFSHIF